MKKIKVVFASAALLLGSLAAFAIADDPLCQTEPIGYSQPINAPQYIIPGTLGTQPGTYSCDLDFSEVCRYVKKSDGTFVPCDGRRVLN